MKKRSRTVWCAAVIVSGAFFLNGSCPFMASASEAAPGRVLLAQSQAPKFNRVDPELLNEVSNDANFPPELIEALKQQNQQALDESAAQPSGQELQAPVLADAPGEIPQAPVFPDQRSAGLEMGSDAGPQSGEALTLPQEFSPSPDTKENAVSKWDALPAESPVLLAGSVSAPGALSDELNTVKIDHLELKDMDIMDVLKLIAQKTGLNIIVGKGVQGKVTIYLNGVSATEALRIILDANGLAYKYDDGIVRVMTAQEYERRYGQVFGGKSQTKVYHLNYAKAEDLSPLIEHLKSSTGKIISDLKSNTIVVMDARENAEMIEALIREVDIPVEVEVFELNYAKVEDIVAKIEPLITQSVGSVRFDERSNKIIVTDKPSKMGVIARLIREFDVQDRQVLIEAKIVQIQLSDSYELGVDWKAVFPGMDDLTAQSDFDVISNSESNRGKLQIGTITTNNYTAMIEALQTIGKTNVLSSPSITVVNNQEAKILVGTTQPYVTTTTTTPASGPTTVSESVNFIEVGVKLYVVPTIHSDGFITMKIKPEVSTALTPITTGQNNEIPVVETSEAETIVRIKDGVTVVIGGLIKDEKRSTIKKVPLLGNVPLLGKFFRNTDDSVVKTEIAIFLTPRVMIGDQQEQHSFITEKK